MPERIRNFDDEIAWKERQKELEEEKKFKETLEEEKMKKGDRFLADPEEGIMQRCYFLLGVIEKYLTVNNGDFSTYDALYNRYNYLVKHCLCHDEYYTYEDIYKYVVRPWKEFHDIIKLYIHDDIGYDNIKIYLPKGTKIPKVKKNDELLARFLLNNIKSTVNKTEDDLKNDKVAVNKAIQDKLSQKD